MKNLTRAGFFAGAIVISTFGSASLYSSTNSDVEKAYLLKVSDVFQAAQLVESIGGVVSETAASIGYLGVHLTDSELQLLSRSELVVRISEHQSIESNEIADARNADLAEAVAGFIWQK